MRIIITLILIVMAGGVVSAYDKAFDKTSSGNIEIKTIPEHKVITSYSDKQYFQTDNGMFMKLFRYIDSNQVSMTVPVKSDVTTPQMSFYILGNDLKKELESDDSVTVNTIPSQTVISYGAKGAYNEKNFKDGVKKVQEWLKQNPKYSKTGDPYCVYWDGPFKPWFMKHYEVHIPVKETTLK